MNININLIVLIGMVTSTSNGLAVTSFTKGKSVWRKWLNIKIEMLNHWISLYVDANPITNPPVFIDLSRVVKSNYTPSSACESDDFVSTSSWKRQFSSTKNVSNGLKLKFKLARPIAVNDATLLRSPM
jgi:hypothetical protein